MAKNSYDVQEEAKKAYEAANPKPKLPVSNVEAPQIVRHGNGRLWLEITGLIMGERDHSWSTESGVELRITLSDRAESVSIRVDQLVLLRDEIDLVLNNVALINDQKQAYLEARRIWDEGYQKAGSDAVEAWRRAQPKEEKTQRPKSRRA